MQFTKITSLLAILAFAVANPVPEPVAEPAELDADLEARQSSGRCCATGFAVVNGQTRTFFLQVPQGTGGVVTVSPLSGCNIGVARASGCGGFSITTVSGNCGTGRSVQFVSC